MTLRLVGLMSVVLLLCLAAFGLLVSHYQDQVMQEVERTASAVGKETLRTLELPSQPGERVVRVTRHVTAGGVQRMLFLRAEGAPDGPDTLPEEHDVFIDVEEIHVERVPAAAQLLVRIPTVAPADGAGGTAGAGGSRWVAAAGAQPARVEREFEFPIPLGDYESRFGELRRRSVFVFLGVFAVGTVLSAGLASRFTRPVRRLDGAIRRLAEGDLDARVEIRSRDEIGRLGSAFNEMAGRLRAARDREREMLRREKLTALGGLAAGVAHDVRNPLHSIGLTLQHMSETTRPEPGERADEFDRSLDVIRGEIRRLDQLVVNFMRFARSDRRERRPVDLAELLRETERLIRKEAEWRGVAIELDLLETVPAVTADGEALRSSVLNLVLNAFDAMPEGGRLTLRLRVAGDAASVEVADTGRGIPQDELERVFEFAYTTREGGNGLGLAMVQHCVVEEHGGRVSIDSEPGRGTRVVLAIPIRMLAAERA